jgi:hypothetical protein
MKEFIGTKVTVIADGFTIKGTVVEDRSDRVSIKEEEGKIIRVIKSKISIFTPEKEPEQFVPLQLLCCVNPETKCPGVFFVSEGNTLNKESFSVFMDPCPMKNSKCLCKTRGDVRTVSSSTLKMVLSGTVFGDYPEKVK